MCSKYIKVHDSRDVFLIIAAIDFFYFQGQIVFAKVPIKQSRSGSAKLSVRCCLRAEAETHRFREIQRSRIPRRIQYPPIYAQKAETAAE